MELIKFEDYFQFIGSSFFDAYVMYSLNKDVKFITNKRNDSGILMKVVSWPFDVERCMLEEEEEFKMQLKLLFHSNQPLAANISLLRKDKGNHRNLLFLDFSNNVLQLFEPNVVDSDEKFEPNVVDSDEKEAAVYRKNLAYFVALVKSIFNEHLDYTRLYNFGSWMAYRILYVTGNEKLVEVAKVGPCVLYCYLFLMWILKTKDRSCKGNLGPIVETELNLEEITAEILRMVQKQATIEQLFNTPLNCIKAFYLL